MRDRTARTAGVLFIVATVASVVGSALVTPLLDEQDYLTAVSLHANRVAAGALLGLIAAAASVGIAITLYPVLRRWGGGLALGSVVFRSIEGVMYMIGVACWLALLAVGQRFAPQGAADATSLRAVGDSLIDVHQQVALIGVFAFCVGAFLYYYLFYQSRLVPRWLSGWGIGAIALMFLACVLALFGQNEITSYVALALPIGVQELVLAVWLIARGFSAPDLGSGVDVEEGRDAGVSALRSAIDV